MAEKEPKMKMTIPIDPAVDEIIVIRSGTVHRAKANAGRGSCRDCSLNNGRGAKTCPWSMVCSNVVNGANFSIYESPQMKKAREERELARHSDAMCEEYRTRRYHGD